MAGLILGRAEFGFAQSAFETREQVRDGLGIVPNVRAGAVAAPRVITAAFPGPKPAVCLPQDRRRFEDGEIGSDGFQNFGGERRIIEALAEAVGLPAQFVIVIAPIETDTVNVGEPGGIPGAEALG